MFNNSATRADYNSSKHTTMKKGSTTKGAAAKAAATAKATTKSSARAASSKGAFEKAKTLSAAEAKAQRAENKAQAIVSLVKGFNFEAQDKAIGVAQKDLFMERTLPLARKMANLEKQIKAMTNKERIAFAEWEPFGVTQHHMKTKLVGKYCRVGRGLANAAQVKAFEAWCRKENCNPTLVNADKYLGDKKPAPKGSDSLVKLAVNAKELGTEKGATATKTAKGWDTNLSKAELRKLFLTWAEELK